VIPVIVIIMYSMKFVSVMPWAQQLIFNKKVRNLYIYIKSVGAT